MIVQLGIVRQLMATREAALFSSLPLNPSQFGVLNHFTHKPDRSWTVTDLARVMEMNQPGITKIISVLLEKNLLESISDIEDKRRRYLKITSQGLRLCEETMASLMPDISHLFSNWQDEELNQMQEHTEKLMRWLDNHRDDFTK
nr:MarR family transcriptional regulator [Vibrio amylolyticus]